MSGNNYKDLLVWQKAMQVAQSVYKLVKKLPKEETFALSDQMRRAVVSIPSNIAEGQEKNSSKDFVRFLSIAQGSRAELETQLLLATSIGYFDNTEIEPVLHELNEIGRMINALIKTVGETGNWKLETGN